MQFKSPRIHMKSQPQDKAAPASPPCRAPFRVYSSQSALPGKQRRREMEMEGFLSARRAVRLGAGQAGSESAGQQAGSSRLTPSPQAECPLPQGNPGTALKAFE